MTKAALGVGQQLAALVALEIGEEAEAARVALVEQHHAHIRHAIGIDAGQGPWRAGRSAHFPGPR
jgi:hypothetical protein